MKSNFNFTFTTDLLIFGIGSRKNFNTRSLSKKYLSILLVKRNSEPFFCSWCLPGDFVNIDETSSESACRVLMGETGLSDVYMQELQVSDDVNRDPRGRVVSVSYMSLVDRSQIGDDLSEDASWFDILLTEIDNKIIVNLTNGKDTISYKVSKIPMDVKSDLYNYKVTTDSKLAFDHDKLIIKAIMNLRNKVNSTDIVFNLMPDLFTIGELKQVYELILNKKLINSAFRRTMADKIEFTKELVKTGGHRPSFLCKYIGK